MKQLTGLVTKGYWVHHAVLWKAEGAMALPHNIPQNLEIAKHTFYVPHVFSSS